MERVKVNPTYEEPAVAMTKESYMENAKRAFTYYQGSFPKALSSVISYVFGSFVYAILAFCLGVTLLVFHGDGKGGAQQQSVHDITVPITLQTFSKNTYDFELAFNLNPTLWGGISLILLALVNAAAGIASMTSMKEEYLHLIYILNDAFVTPLTFVLTFVTWGVSDLITLLYCFFTIHITSLYVWRNRVASDSKPFSESFKLIFNPITGTSGLKPVSNWIESLANMLPLLFLVLSYLPFIVLLSTSNPDGVLPNVSAIVAFSFLAISFLIKFVFAPDYKATLIRSGVMGYRNEADGVSEWFWSKLIIMMPTMLFPIISAFVVGYSYMNDNNYMEDKSRLTKCLVDLLPWDASTTLSNFPHACCSSFPAIARAVCLSSSNSTCGGSCNFIATINATIAKNVING